MKIGKSATVTPKAQKELDIAMFKARKLSRLVSELQRRLDKLGTRGATVATGCPLWT